MRDLSELEINLGAGQDFCSVPLLRVLRTRHLNGARDFEMKIGKRGESLWLKRALVGMA